MDIRRIADGLRTAVGLLPRHFCFLMPNFYFLFFISYFLTSCGVDSDRFRFEGRLRNMNQGEFWVYSADGAMEGIDTISVREGRFEYETELRVPTTFIVIFPNYSEQPVFAEPGEVVTLKGDASHLKEMTIKGTDDNEAMTNLRMELNRLMPPEIPKAVETFIREHAQSRVSNYLLQRYFVEDAAADYKKAYELVTLLQKAQPDNGQLANWKKKLERLKNGSRNSKLPAFQATDVKGRTVTQNDLKAQANVVMLWATWNYHSVDMHRRVQRLKDTYAGKLGVVSISVDGDTKEVKRRVTRDSLTWKTVCDGRMWQSPLVSQFGFTDVPSNLVVNDKGVIVERNLSPQKLEEKIREMLK